MVTLRGGGGHHEREDHKGEDYEGKDYEGECREGEERGVNETGIALTWLQIVRMKNLVHSTITYAQTKDFPYPKRDPDFALQDVDTNASSFCGV